MKIPITALLLAVAATAPGAHARDNIDHGATLYQSRCSACHSIDSNRVGPAHRDTFGRRVGTAPGYDYSVALRRSKLVWTAANLDRWLSDPERLIPGQKMGYAVPDAGDRADLIAYLKSQSAHR
jgi:cytochrome c